ncbi:MAG: translation elongation factor Ts [Planctomycetota bacterium]
MAVEITAAMVKDLREATGAGMMDCKHALIEAQGDMEKAKEILRKKGLKVAEKKAGRAASQGRIGSYIHFNHRIGVLVEVNCETDFAANTAHYQEFLKDVAMHIGAMSPMWVSREEIPPAVKEKELEVARAAMEAQLKGKPKEVVEKILDGRLAKFYEEKVLLDQPFCKDPTKTIGQLLKEMIARIGENALIRRFTRFEVGA